MSSPRPITDEEALAALDIILRPLGSATRHYTPQSREAGIKAMRFVLQADPDQFADALRIERK